LHWAANGVQRNEIGKLIQSCKSIHVCAAWQRRSQRSVGVDSCRSLDFTPEQEPDREAALRSVQELIKILEGLLKFL